MFLKQKKAGHQVEVLGLEDLINLRRSQRLGRPHYGEEIQEPELFAKDKGNLVFHSGEALPRCGVDSHDCDPPPIGLVTPRMSRLLQVMSGPVLAVSLSAMPAVTHAIEPSAWAAVADRDEHSSTGRGVPDRLEKAIEERIQRHTSYGDVILGHADKLKLTDEQMGKILRLHQANQVRVMALSRKLREATKGAHALFLDPTKDEASIRQAAKAHTLAFEELVDTALTTRKAINAILTPEQVAQLSLLKPEIP